MAIWFNDTFTDTNLTALTSHTSDSGASWVSWLGSSSPVVYTSHGGIVASGGTSQELYRESVIDANADVAVTASFYYDSINFVSVGIAARLDSLGNSGYLAVYNQTSTKWEIYRLGTGGATTLLAQSAVITYTAGATPTAIFQVQGSGSSVVLNLTVNSTLVIGPYTDASGLVVAAGYVGVWFYTTAGSANGMFINSLSAADLSSNVLASPLTSVSTIASTLVSSVALVSGLASISAMGGNLSTPGALNSVMSSVASMSLALSAGMSIQSALSSVSSVAANLSTIAVTPSLLSWNYADRVKDTTTTSGVGTITLSGSAPTGYQPFGGAFAVGTSLIPYCIADQSGSNWEAGTGTVVTSTTFSRDVITASSNAGAPVTFGSNTKDVFCVVPAAAIKRMYSKDFIDLRDYNVDPTFTVDSTAGITQAINDAYNNNKPEIRGHGHFMIAGPLLGNNSQIAIPNTRQASHNKTIIFRGMAPPNLETQGIVSVPVTSNGLLFESTIVGTGAQPSMFAGATPNGGDSMPWNYTNIGFENCGFRTSSSAGANTMSAVDLSTFSQVVAFDKIRIDTNVPVLGSPSLAGGVSNGLIMPPINNHAQFNIGTILIAGYANGVVFNEHFCAKSIIVLGCLNAIVLGNAYHSSQIGMLLVECCKNSIVINGNHGIAISLYDTEHNSSGNWYDFNADIVLNSGTRKVAILQSNVVVAGVGISDASFTSNSSTCYKIVAGSGAN